MDWNMKATVLGWCGGFPRGGQATCSVLVETPEGAVLLDCGSGSLSNFFRVSDVDRLHGVLLSHLHYDHIGDLGCLQYSINHALRVGLRKKKLPVHAPKTPVDMWKTIQYPYTESFVLCDGMTIEMAGMKITVKKVNHTIECYAFRLERNGKSIVYFTDTTYLPDAHIFVNGADLFFCEATSTSGSCHSTGKGHMSDVEAGYLAKESGVKNLCLIHLPSDAPLLQIKERAESTFGKPVFMPDIDEISTFYV
ncbi:MAG: MBL fold metallo-hydrolase [Christensenella sp.]|uniref:MBL fold metallo-hydrolase n=1 Tax=Christensenella sp. TaxID=1935934 RepID=UPI002B1F789B|nr:MBL fold metallo-hydrolase [Christensenella sp.]MEA5004569.1 MBL fold metallo-hydrolase [Christensenella sp.]